MVLRSRGRAMVLRDNVVGRRLGGEVAFGNDVKLGGDVELRSGGSMEPGRRNGGTCCASMAALWRSVASIWVCASCEHAGLAWMSENGDNDSCSPVYMGLAVLRHSVASISWCQASDSQVGKGSVCWVHSWRDHSITWGEGGPKNRRKNSVR